MTELHFGECPYCDGVIERPFWDLCCFNCQDEIREEGEEEAQRIADEDHYLYAIPATLCDRSEHANSHERAS